MLFETPNDRRRERLAVKISAKIFGVNPEFTSTVCGHDAIAIQNGLTFAFEHKGRDLKYERMGSIFIEKKKVDELLAQMVDFRIMVVSYWEDKASESPASVYCGEIEPMTQDVVIATMLRTDRNGEWQDYGYYVPLGRMTKIYE